MNRRQRDEAQAFDEAWEARARTPGSRWDDEIAELVALRRAALRGSRRRAVRRSSGTSLRTQLMTEAATVLAPAGTRTARPHRPAGPHAVLRAPPSPRRRHGSARHRRRLRRHGRRERRGAPGRDAVPGQARRRERRARLPQGRSRPRRSTASPRRPSASPRPAASPTTARRSRASTWPVPSTTSPHRRRPAAGALFRAYGQSGSEQSITDGQRLLRRGGRRPRAALGQGADRRRPVVPGRGHHGQRARHQGVAPLHELWHRRRRRPRRRGVVTGRRSAGRRRAVHRRRPAATDDSTDRRARRRVRGSRDAQDHDPEPAGLLQHAAVRPTSARHRTPRRSSSSPIPSWEHSSATRSRRASSRTCSTSLLPGSRADLARERCVGASQKNALPRSTSRAYSVCWIVSRTWSVTLNSSIGSSAASGS